MAESPLANPHSTRLFRAFLRLYPRDFQLLFGQSMLETYRERLQVIEAGFETNPSRLKKWIFLFRESAGMLAGAVRSRRNTFTGKGGGPGPRIVSGLKSSYRSLRGSPGYAAASIGILALGIGSATAVFSVVNGVLLSSLPFDDPDRIVSLWAENEENGSTASFRVVELQAFEENASSVSAIGGIYPTQVTINSPEGEALIEEAAMISAGYFDVFGVEPNLGRTISPAEVQSGEALVVVLSHRFWRDFFGSDPAVLSETLDLDGTPFTIIGVLPEAHRSMPTQESSCPTPLEPKPGSGAG